MGFIIRVLQTMWREGFGNTMKAYMNPGLHLRRPVELMYWQRFTDIHKAISWEKQIKGWSRKKEEALFKEDWEQIVLLSKNREGRNQSSTSSD